MASFTLVNASSCTDTAKAIKVLACVFLYADCSTDINFCLSFFSAVATARVTAPFCKKDADPIVLCMRSRASSSVRILMVAPMACISSLRVDTRSSYSLSKFSHLVVRSTMNLVSASRDALVSSKSSRPFARSSLVCDKRPSLSSICLVAESISPCFAAFSFWKLSLRSNSAFCASLRLPSISSCICLRTPRILPERALYDS
mmetsp:Transcript_41838/g.100504  ORF Transcript_41838/g.100504 Transcript_41838/m.100504 type:complete len:202 (+) Transcript_41838:864-1469(+)